MRVVLADPPAYTPPYDHHLAAALARSGVDVELVTSPFRFGERPAADGYRLDESFYRRSGRVDRGALRLVGKAAEHPFAMRRLLQRPADVLHLQWLDAPELDSVLLRPRVPTVFTAHDLLPRRTARHVGLWRRLLSRFDAVVVHSRRGFATLAAFGVPQDRLHLVPHPVFRHDVERRDDGATVLALGVIRAYKGLPDAVAAVARLPHARLLVAGDPRVSLDGLDAQAPGRIEWRLGYLGPAEIEESLARATVAVFPYSAELDQSGALLEALGTGIPAVVYDVGGLGEVVRAFGAGRVVSPGDVDGLTSALDELLSDAGALALARQGAERARVELTWDVAAEAHVRVYEEIA